jgi:hypothetical protein
MSAERVDAPITEAEVAEVTKLPTKVARGAKGPEKPAKRLVPTTVEEAEAIVDAEDKAAKPAAPKRHFPITRFIAPGQTISGDAVFTPSVDQRSLLIRGNKNWTRAASFPPKGEGKTVAAILKDGPTTGDIRWWLERGMAEISGQEIKYRSK